jgi:hypothetical protein
VERLRAPLPLDAVLEPDVRDLDPLVAVAVLRRAVVAVERLGVFETSAAAPSASPTASVAMAAALSAVDLVYARSCSTSALSWSTRRRSFASFDTRFRSLATIFAWFPEFFFAIRQP